MAGKIYSKYDSKVTHPASQVEILTDTLQDLLYGLLSPLRTGFTPLRSCHLVEDVHRRKSCGWDGRIGHCQRWFDYDCQVHPDGEARR
jgi:hypothetical protein